MKDSKCCGCLLRLTWHCDLPLGSVACFYQPVKQDLRWDCKGTLLTTSRDAQATEGLGSYIPEERDEGAPSALGVPYGHGENHGCHTSLNSTKFSEELSPGLPETKADFRAHCLLHKVGSTESCAPGAP